MGTERGSSQAVRTLVSERELSSFDREQLIEVVRAQRERIADYEHTILTLRDHAVGAEAVLGTSRKTAERDAEALREVYASRTWLAGSLIRHPMVGGRRVLKAVWRRAAS